MITLTMKSTWNLYDSYELMMKSTMMKMPTRSEAGRMASVFKPLNRQLSLSDEPPLRKLKLQCFVED